MPDASTQTYERCDCCECELEEHIHIECLENNDGEEMTVCHSCWEDLEEDFRREGWVLADEPNEFCEVCGEWKPKACCSETADGKWICQKCDYEEDDEEDDESEWMTFHCRKCGKTFKSPDGEECIHCHYVPRIDGPVDVDDKDAPNIYPYKKCSECVERSSCGSYNEEGKWVCEGCA